MQPQVKQRNSNLELYRIIVMLLIVAHHYVVNSGLMEEMAKEPLSSRSIFFYIFWNVGKDWYQLLCADNRLFHVQITNHNT